MFNLHMHTFRCRHADGNDRDYVEAAIKAGYKEIGFSDHAPMIFPNGSGSYFRMAVEEYEGYVKSVLDLKKEYKKDIEIHLGLEAEYYPKIFDVNLKFWCSYPIEYLLLAPHFIGNEYDSGSVYSGSNLINDDILVKYVDQTIEAIRTKLFTYVAHPDVIKYRGDKKFYQQQMQRLCLTAKEYDIPLEVNFLGFYTNRIYPNPLFFEVASKVKNKIIAGLDAHTPIEYLDKKNYDRMLDFVKSYGLEIIDKMPKLINPKQFIK